MNNSSSLHRVVVIDGSPFDDLERLSDGANRVLDHEGVDRLIVLGQSLAGILGQIYLKRNSERVDAVVLRVDSGGGSGLAPDFRFDHRR